jgi:large subunit ribosomal protein LP1
MLILVWQSDKIVALTSAAGVDVEPIWASLLAKALEGKDVKDLLSNVGSGGGAPAVGGAPAAAGGAPAEAAAAETKEEKKEEEKEESDDDMVCEDLQPPLIVSGLVNHLFFFRALVYSTECLLSVGFCSLAHFPPHISIYIHMVTHCMHLPTPHPQQKVETTCFACYMHV